jgi:hypothetical protein
MLRPGAHGRRLLIFPAIFRILREEPKKKGESALALSPLELRDSVD